MTERQEPVPLEGERFEAAADDLARVRQALMAAGRGEAAPSQVKESLQHWLDAHGPELRQAAAALSVEVRRQTLQELYKWRAELDAQLEARGQGRAPTAGDAEPNP
jgi:hypothetical protein